MDNHFRDLKIKELTEQLAMAREENKTLKSRVLDLEAKLSASGGSRSIEERPISDPYYVPSDNKCNQADVR